MEEFHEKIKSKNKELPESFQFFTYSRNLPKLSQLIQKTHLQQKNTY